MEDAYVGIRANQPFFLKKVRESDASSQKTRWYVKLWGDLFDNDLLLTFGPMSQQDAQSLYSVLKGTYTHLEERYTSPFERDLEAEVERDDDDRLV